MQWTLVTGGAKGLGAQLAINLALKGHAILVHYYSSENEAGEIVNICRSHGVPAECIQGDFSSPESIERFIQGVHQRFSEIKILINNVGNYLVKSASQTSALEWNAIFQNNLHAPFALSQAFLPSIRQAGGSIINIGVAGVNFVRADTYSTAYSAAKMGLWMLTRSMAKELAAEGVRVNMVSPGYLENAVDLPANTHLLPMQRAAAFDEVSRVIIFLLDEQNAYITGQNIEVAGGVRL